MPEMFLIKEHEVKNCVSADQTNKNRRNEVDALQTVCQHIKDPVIPEQY